MTITRVPPQQCPECKAKLDAATGIEEGTIPKAGDLTVCIVCTAVLTYDPGLIVRPATKDELRKLPPAILFDLVRTQTLIREMHRERRRTNYKNN